MSDTLPMRDTACPAALPLPFPGQRKTNAHIPEKYGVVENGLNEHMEWQFSSCHHCNLEIARYRLLDGSMSWFDQWGYVHD